MPTELLGLSLEELREFARQSGEPPYRGNQLYEALYAGSRSDFREMTSLPKRLRERWAQEATITRPQVVQRYRSADGTIRYLLGLADGKSIETVWMPEVNRQTLCLSTQAGCAVDCHFCATAQLGLVRQLSVGEIVGQALVALAENYRHLRAQTNIVLMGQGEPLLNFDATMRAVNLLADPAGVDISLRRITLSTSGIVPGIDRLAAEPRRPRLAVSLNATTDEQRTAIMPINRKYPLAELLAACRRFPLRPRERMTFEYVLLGGFNDTAADARRLVKLLAGLRSRVNLIPWNPVPEIPYQAPQKDQVHAFQRALRQAGLLAFIRQPRGQDVYAACGQLATLEVPAPAG